MAWREHFLTIDQAKVIVARDRHKQELEESRGCSFSKEKINAILNQDGCIGIRIYFGKVIDDQTKEFNYSLVVVGVQGDQANDPPSSCDDMHTGLMAEYGYSVHVDDVKDNSDSPLARD
jgi:hypothetical protein